MIVIGDNPATEIKTNWWLFWDDMTGFDLTKFDKAYAEARGKTRVSKTRLRLNRLRTKGLNCLETNVFSNERPRGHGENKTFNHLLPFFLDSLPDLVAVIAHGAVAQRCLEKLPVPLHVKRYQEAHFRSLSYRRLDEIIKEILRAVSGE